jgi:phosphate transport system substrate-binding protein
LPIKVLHRTDGKGSNYIFSDFLSKLSPEFRAKVGKNVSPKWPVGAAFSRCEDLLANAAKTSGAIGYVELRCSVLRALSGNPESQSCQNQRGNMRRDQC